MKLRPAKTFSENPATQQHECLANSVTILCYCHGRPEMASLILHPKWMQPAAPWICFWVLWHDGCLMIGEGVPCNEKSPGRDNFYMRKRTRQELHT